MSDAIGSILKNPAARMALIYGGGGLLALYLLPKVIPALVKLIGESAGNLVKGTAGAVATLAGEAAHAVSPTNSENIFYHDIVGGIGRAASGDEAWTFGGFIYDVFHKEYDPNVGPTGANLINYVAQAPLKIQDRPTVDR